VRGEKRGIEGGRDEEIVRVRFVREKESVRPRARAREKESVHERR
jgi:hypothetical protein